MKYKKKINLCIVSSTRADFGIMSDLIIKIQKDKFFNLNFIVTGSHLEEKYGETIKEIKKKKINISKKIKILSKKNDKLSILNNSSSIIHKFSEYLKKSYPNLIILLGDRYETFCIAFSAYILGIPILHLYGGEITNNSLDDSLRHSITKLAHFHAVSNSNSNKRVNQLGEEKEKIITIGSLSLDNLNNFRFISKKKIEKILNIKLSKNIIIFTLHPETNNLKNLNAQINSCLQGLNKFNNVSIIMTLPNDDISSDYIINKIKMFSRKRKNIFFYKSLGRELYLSLLKIADVIVGNSSSGIIEAPSLNTYTINLGDRQKGRDQAKGIINLKFDKKLIQKNIKLVLNKKKKNFFNPYYKKNALNNLIKFIKNINFKNIKIKKFTDYKK